MAFFYASNDDSNRLPDAFTGSSPIRSASECSCSTYHILASRNQRDIASQSARETVVFLSIWHQEKCMNFMPVILFQKPVFMAFTAMETYAQPFIPISFQVNALFTWWVNALFTWRVNTLFTWWVKALFTWWVKALFTQPVHGHGHENTLLLPP